jgi:hypothetical protein
MYSDWPWFQSHQVRLNLVNDIRILISFVLISFCDMYVWIRQLHWYVLFSFHSSKHTQKEPILNVSLRERAHPTTTSPDRPNITSAHIRMDVKRLVMDDYGLVQQPRSKIQTHSNCVTLLLEFKDAASQCDCIATVESQTLEHSFVHTSSLQLVTCTTILLLSSPLPNKKIRYH